MYLKKKNKPNSLKNKPIWNIWTEPTELNEEEKISDSRLR